MLFCQEKYGWVIEISFLCTISVHEFHILTFKFIFYCLLWPSDSPGIMLLIYSRKGGHIPLDILCIEDGKRLKSFKHLLHRNKKVDFIEQFNEKLLIKQEGENLQILDVSILRRLQMTADKATLFSVYCL